ncbi:MAG: hypothetical protein VX296_07000, partial [Pseudomonadota bacterium]|nr:hypothetical protein [Pseudomonadota bacterium]
DERPRTVGRCYKSGNARRTGNCLITCCLQNCKDGKNEFGKKSCSLFIDNKEPKRASYDMISLSKCG